VLFRLFTFFTGRYGPVVGGARARTLPGLPLKGDTVTLTNHIRNIEDLAPQCMEFADAKQYPLAHCALDDIEKEVRKLHRHIDHLQNVSDFCARPAGEDTS